MSTHHAIVDTELGDVTLVAADDFLVGLYFPQHWYKPSEDRFGPRVDARLDVILDAARTQLTEYLRGDRTSFQLPTAAAGNPFQQRIWAMLTEIPFGETTTYGDLAGRLGDRSLSQAVGQAVGHNPLSVVIPCHRVVGKDAKITGYAGGLTRKRLLLELEEPSLAKAGKLF